MHSFLLQVKAYFYFIIEFHYACSNFVILYDQMIIHKINESSAVNIMNRAYIVRCIDFSLM